MAIAIIERQFEALSPRDKKLLGGLVGFGGLLFIGLLWYGLYGILESKASRVRDAKETLASMQELRQEYDVAAQRFAAQEARLRGQQPVTAFIEDLAIKHDIKEQLRAVNAQGAEQVGDLVQTRYTVEVKKAPQENLYEFLYDLETSGYPASVEEATFKVSYVKREKMQDLTLDLIVLSVGEG